MGREQLSTTVDVGGRVLSSALDQAGRQLATASEGQQLRVFEKADDGDWRCTASWAAHTAALRGVAWASSAFGALLASCADDGCVKLWRPAQQGWAQQASLGGDRAPAVLHIAFAPAQHGLLLAAACADGTTRVYEPADAAGVGAWDLQSAFEAGPSCGACTALGWAPHVAGRPPTLAVAAGGAPAGVWTYLAGLRRWQRACALPPPGAGDITALAWSPVAALPSASVCLVLDGIAVEQFHADAAKMLAAAVGSALSLPPLSAQVISCDAVGPSATAVAVLLQGAGAGADVERLLKLLPSPLPGNPHANTAFVEKLNDCGLYAVSHSGVTGVQRYAGAEAALPGLRASSTAAGASGRPWELLASVCGSRVALWRVQLGEQPVVAPAAEPFAHPATVCNAEWNMMGTTLATTAHDGRIRLWQETFTGGWREHAL